MNYQQTLDYMFNSLPMYHRVGGAAYKANLDNTVALMEHLGHPERQLRCIHVAGTNGKGSVSHLTASLLQQIGLKVGLYTSPHLVDFRERIRIGGTMIPQDEVTAFVEQHKTFMQGLQLSFFEMTVGLAFDYFARQQVDIAVIEVGMGGRLDSTNVITPLLSVITNIGLDHTQFLGSTLPEIAAEKAGIIKPGVPVVVGETQPDTAPVFNHTAATLNAPIAYADQCYHIAGSRSAVDSLDISVADAHQLYGQTLQLHSPLAGDYQLKNLLTFMRVAEFVWQMPEVAEKADNHADPQAFRRTTMQHAVSDVIATTGLHGRWEVLHRDPLVVCETAHNAPGISAMLGKLGTLHYRRLVIIYGCVGDKDYATILRMLPSNAIYHYTQPSVPRALPVAQLAATADTNGRHGTTHPDVHKAIATAIAEAQPDDLILVTGSIYLVADAFCQTCQ